MMRLPDALIRRLVGPAIELDGHALDLRVQLSLRLARLLHKKDAPELGPAGYRRELDALGPTLAPDPPPLAETRDVRVPRADGSPGPARLYVPSGLPATSPGLVYFHGGGFVAGSLESHDSVCRALAIGAACRVLSVEYRLAPEHVFPAAADDAVAAFLHAVERATELGLDPARVAVGGDSAGGNISAGASLDLRAAARRPAAQLLIYPAIDMTMSSRSIQTLGEGFFLERATIEWFRNQYLPEGTDRRTPRASPLFAEVAGAPPAIVATAGFDPLRDEGIAYAKKLREAGVHVTEHVYGGLFHGFANATGGVPAARSAMNELARDLRGLLDPEWRRKNDGA